MIASRTQWLLRQAPSAEWFSHLQFERDVAASTVRSPLYAASPTDWRWGTAELHRRM